MIDLTASILSSLNSSAWTSATPPSTPALTEITFAGDEYEPNKLPIEILVEDFPDDKDNLTTGLKMVRQRAKITIYVRPKAYDKTTLDAAKVIFINMKTKIDTILKGLGISYEVSGWNDGNTVSRGRGLKNKSEPVIFRSSETVSKIYYI